MKKIYRFSLVIIVVAAFSCMQNPSKILQGNGVLLSETLDGLPQFKDYIAKRVSSYDHSGGNADNRQINPGKTLVLAEINGAGCITHIWFTIWHPEWSFLKKLVLRAYWDGSETPCVEAPVGDFFGLGFGQIYHYVSAPFHIAQSGGLNCFFKMPYSKKALITVTNEGEKPCQAFYYYVNYREYKSIPENWGRFHAQYRQERPCEEGKHYTILEAKGKGHFVGCHLSIETTTSWWWGEGDDRIFVDGEKFPSLHGTGSEDYIGGAWCFGPEFYTPHIGVPLRARWKNPYKMRHYTRRGEVDSKDFEVDPWRAGDLWNVYRYHIEDPIPFTKSILVEIEHGDDGVNRNNRPDNFSSVAYWYQNEPHDKPPAFPSVEKRVAPPVKAQPRQPNVYEAEDFQYEARLEKGNVSVMGKLWLGDIWSDGEALAFNGKEIGARITINLPVTEAGEYVLEGLFVKWKEYGVFEVEVNGKKIEGSFDGYLKSLLPQVSSSTFGPVKLEPGSNSVSFIVTESKSPEQLKYKIGLDRLEWKKKQ